jgi:hypothetical protein
MYRMAEALIEPCWVLSAGIRFQGPQRQDVMSHVLNWFMLALVVAACLAAPAPILGEEQELLQSEDTAVERDDSWYREQPAYKPDTRAIIIQKAQIRAEQRQERMASLAWYGMSNSRPTGAPTPFTSRYSPVWEMPGGRPFAWYPYARPGYVMYWR